jgi:predicted nucleic acid-binding protein
MIPVVLSELLSVPKLNEVTELALLTIPMLETRPGYWSRAGKTRASLLGLGYRPKLADTLIAQMCLDHRALLLSRDRDFSAFRKHFNLKLMP